VVAFIRDSLGLLIALLPLGSVCRGHSVVMGVRKNFGRRHWASMDTKWTRKSARSSVRKVRLTKLVLPILVASISLFLTVSHSVESTSYENYLIINVIVVDKSWSAEQNYSCKQYVATSTIDDSKQQLSSTIASLEVAPFLG